MSDIKQNPIVRRFGIRGAKIYGAIWFVIMYALLIAIAGCGLSVFTHGELATSQGTTIIIYFAVILIVTAASLLTRILLRWWAELQELESQTKKSL